MPRSPLPPLLQRWEASDLSELLRRRARRPDRARIGFYERATGSYRTVPQHDFLRRAAVLGRRQLAAGTRAGDRVAVACDTPEALLVGFTSSVLIGAVPALVAVRSGFDAPAVVAERLARTRKLLGPRSTTLAEDDEFAADAPGGTVLRLDELDAGAADVDGLGPAPDGALSHVQLTSGSTGAGGRAVAVTHRSLFANLAALSRRMELGPDSVIGTWLPLYHDMGLVGQVLLALTHGIDLFVMSPFDFVLDPAAWLRTVSDERVTMSASPTFGFELARRRVSDEEIGTLDLSSWKTACCGAEPVSATTVAGFVERFARCGLRPTTVTPCYGLAEATLAVTMPPVGATWRAVRVERSSLARMGEVVGVAGTDGNGCQGPPAADEVDVVALGGPMDGLTVELVDDAGDTIDAPLTCGEVVVHGDSTAGGYLDDTGEPVPFDGGLRTGDIGFLEGGELFVVERIKNIVIRNGQNYSVQVLETTLARLAGLPAHKVMMLDGDFERGARLTGVIELDPSADPTVPVEAVRDGLHELELPLEVLVVVRAGSLPHTTSGKRQHAEVRRLLREGGLDVLGNYDLHGAPAGQDDHRRDETLEGDVLALVAEHVRARGSDLPVAAGSRLAHDLDLDSLAVVELAIAAEARFGVVVPEEVLAEIVTVADLVAVIRRASPDPDELGLSRSLTRLERSIPQTYRVANEQRGREVLIDGRWVTDFASCNYLGLDLHPDVIAAVEPALETWGVHPSWTRAVASPEPYRQLERALADLVGATDTIVFPTVTLLHIGVLPRLSGNGGAIVLDEAAHHSLHEAAAFSGARGASVMTYRHGDLDELDARLARLTDRSPRIVAIDGVYSMSGNQAALPALLDLARTHDAVLYVDDAHGIGILGERPDPTHPYGRRGNGVVRHQGLGYERIVYVGGLSKAFSSMAAFVTCTGGADRTTLEMASTMVFSGPVPVASLASALAGLEVNHREGDELRGRLWAMTSRLLDGIRSLGLEIDNRSGFPIVNTVLGPTAAVLEACDLLWQHGILLTPALFPAAPLGRGGVRFTVTAANTEDQVDRLLEALGDVRRTVRLRLPAAVGSR